MWSVCVCGCVCGLSISILMCVCEMGIWTEANDPNCRAYGADSHPIYARSMWATHTHAAKTDKWIISSNYTLESCTQLRSRFVSKHTHKHWRVGSTLISIKGCICAASIFRERSKIAAYVGNDLRVDDGWWWWWLFENRKHNTNMF